MAIPAPNHAGGLRYHGMSPIVSEPYHQGEIEAKLSDRSPKLLVTFAFRVEGIPPSSREQRHAIKAAIDEALAAKRPAKKRPFCSDLLNWLL